MLYKITTTTREKQNLKLKKQVKSFTTTMENSTGKVNHHQIKVVKKAAKARKMARIVLKKRASQIKSLLRILMRCQECGRIPLFKIMRQKQLKRASK